MKKNRIQKVYNIIEEKSLDAFLIKGMDNIFYLTGFKGSEGTLVVTKNDVLLITDFRYIAQARETTDGVKIIELISGKNVLSEICGEYKIRRMGFDSHHTLFKTYTTWKTNVREAEFVPVEREIEEIRKYKDPDEIESIRRAIEIATNSFLKTFENLCAGKTEKEFADELEYTMRLMGADCPSFDTIVASGLRASLPHAVPTTKKINQGEAVIVDFGSLAGGYCSDETCTILVGKVDGTIKEIFKVVNDSRKLALEKTKPGMFVKDLDMIVRKYIDDAGYGKFFGHGTGHGVGIAVHEPPYINSAGDGLLEENMVITIEPGIYLPELGGVRLEEMLLITDKGFEILTRINKEMLQISL